MCKKKNVSRKKTTDWLIQASKNKFGDKFDYSHAVYINAKQKVAFRCPKHDFLFYQTSNNHLKSKEPCPKCHKEYMRVKFSDKQAEFKHKIEEIYGDVFLFEKVNYINQRTEVTLICKKHKVSITRKPYVFLKGSGCPECKAIQKRNSLSRERLLEIESFVSKLGGKCLSNDYKDVFSKLEFECKNGHKFTKSWKSIKDSLRWCPKCSPNKLIGESLARQMLENLLNIKLPSSYIPEMNGLQLDGYNSEKKVAFEYQGYQHFTKESHFHNSKNDYQEQRARDNEKKRLCHQYGIQLIEIFEFKTIRQNRIQSFYKQVKKTLSYSSIEYLDKPFEVDLVDLFYGKKSDQFETAKLMVESKGGAIQPYAGSESRHTYTCSKGHEVKGRVLSVIIKSKASCPICEMEEKYLSLKQIIKKRGGKLIDEKLKKNALGSHYTWICDKGHKNESIGYHLTQGIWCKFCQIENSKLQLDKEKETRLKIDLQSGKLLQKEILSKFSMSRTALMQFIKDREVDASFRKYDKKKQRKTTKGRLLQIDPNTFDIIKVYESLEAVKREVNSKYSPSGIRNQMKNNKKAYGYYWCRENDYEGLMKSIKGQ